MKNMLMKLTNKIFLNNSLDGKGERVNIVYNGEFKYDRLDMYQKSHVKRYEFAKLSILSGKDVADFACGTGYGTIILSEKSYHVVGVDINPGVIIQLKKRYKKVANVEFICSDLLHLDYQSYFDYIVSYETIEHLNEEDIPKLFSIFSRALKPGGTIYFSVPYLQPRSPEAISMGFHQTFNIDEEKIREWTTRNGLETKLMKYQNYQTHHVEDVLEHKDFIICVANKT